MEIKVKYFEGAKPIDAIDRGDWIDLRSNETVTLKQGEFRIIRLGVAMELPEGYEAHVLPRSSTFKKWGIILANSMGIIDNSYCGDEDEWCFPAIALRDTTIHAGDRICQFRLMPTMSNMYQANRYESPVKLVSVGSLGNKNRGGFGSTGAK